jgi:LacI family transcriptional regulator
MSTLGLAAVVDSGELNAYFLEILNGVLEAAGRFNQNITVFTLHDWNLDAGRLADFCDGRIDGLILVAPVISETKTDIVPAHTPFVSLHSNNPIPGVIDIESDEEAGAFDIVTHLIGLGHRDILHLSGPDGMQGTKRRLAGYQRALTTARLGKTAKVIEAGYSTENGRNALRAWMSRNAGGTMPTALFCANDAVALGCMEVLSQAGLRVPEDISVVGFDDTLAARTSTPQLTTLRQPLRQMGARAVELLIKPETAPQTKGELIIFPTQAIIRASAVRPPAKSVIVPRL